MEASITNPSATASWQHDDDCRFDCPDRLGRRCRQWSQQLGTVGPPQRQRTKLDLRKVQSRRLADRDTRLLDIGGGGELPCLRSPLRSLRTAISS